MGADLHPVTIKPTVAEVAAWGRQAALAGLTRHAWIRQVLGREAGLSEERLLELLERSERQR